MAAPSQAAYERLQRDPAALSQNPAYFAAEFEAAPWLLPPRTTILPYARMHDLDELLALRAKPARTHEKAVVVLLFNAATAAMAENSSKMLTAMHADPVHCPCVCAKSACLSHTVELTIMSWSDGLLLICSLFACQAWRSSELCCGLLDSH